MSVTIETINGKPHTVVWRGVMPEVYSENQHRRWPTTHGYILQDADFNRVATALRAVPLNADVRRDERLWHAYAAEGLHIRGKFFSEGGDIDYEDEIITFEEKWCEGCSVFCEPVEIITHAIFENEHVEIAIREGTPQ